MDAHIISYDSTHNKSLIAEEYARINDYEEAVSQLRKLQTQVSRNTFKQLIHYNVEIEFNLHLIYVAYKLHGYSVCKQIITEFYDGNPEYLFHEKYNIFREEKLKLYSNYI